MKVKAFTRHLEEESTGYAKLKSKNFRKIRFNEEEKAIMTDQEHAAIAGVSLYIEQNPENFDESYYKAFNDLKTYRQGHNLREIDFDVFYSFSNSVRGNRKYGNSNWSARFLYEFLCMNYNEGERFIDTYLDRVFTIRPVYAMLKSLVQDVKTEIEVKWNDGNLKGGQWASFYRFQSAQMEYLRDALERFSRDIREDIMLCLSIGLIPLRFSLSKSTKDKRKSLGLPSETPFYATSWLINQLELHVILGDNNTGRLYYSDSYKGAN